MPWGLRRFQETGQLHFLTFSCYKRRPNFANAPSRTTFETSLEQVQRYGLCVYGYVVMPEHVHVLVNEPEQGSRSRALLRFVYQHVDVFGHHDIAVHAKSVALYLFERSLERGPGRSVREVWSSLVTAEGEEV